MAKLLFKEYFRRCWPVLLMWGSLRSYGQDGQQAVRDALARSQQVYYHSPYLGFRVKYTYNNEGQAGHHLDSLSGEVQMDKGRCRFAIDGMETVVTDKYTIQVMQEDKAIYISKARKTGQIDPVSMLDSAFSHLSGVKADLNQEDGMDVVTLEFPPGQTYSRIRMKIDRVTGLFRQMNYSLYTAGLVTPDQVESPGHPAPYKDKGQVEVVFSRYEHGRFGDEVFRDSDFFTRTAGRFEPAGRYKNYQVFLASSNL